VTEKGDPLPLKAMLYRDNILSFLPALMEKAAHLSIVARVKSASDPDTALFGVRGKTLK